MTGLHGQPGWNEWLPGTRLVPSVPGGGARYATRWQRASDPLATPRRYETHDLDVARGLRVRQMNGSRRAGDLAERIDPGLGTEPTLPSRPLRRTVEGRLPSAATSLSRQAAAKAGQEWWVDCLAGSTIVQRWLNHPRRRSRKRSDQASTGSFDSSRHRHWPRHRYPVDSSRRPHSTRADR